MKHSLDKGKNSLERFYIDGLGLEEKFKKRIVSRLRISETEEQNISALKNLFITELRLAKKLIKNNNLSLDEKIKIITGVLSRFFLDIEGLNKLVKNSTKLVGQEFTEFEYLKNNNLSDAEFEDYLTNKFCRLVVFGNKFTKLSEGGNCHSWSILLYEILTYLFQGYNEVSIGIFSDDNDGYGGQHSYVGINSNGSEHYYIDPIKGNNDGLIAFQSNKEFVEWNPIDIFEKNIVNRNKEDSYGNSYFLVTKGNRYKISISSEGMIQVSIYERQENGLYNHTSISFPVDQMDEFLSDLPNSNYAKILGNIILIAQKGY